MAFSCLDDGSGRSRRVGYVDREERIFLRADKTVAYGDLMQTMNALRDAGYLKVALVGLERSEQ